MARAKPGASKAKPWSKSKGRTTSVNDAWAEEIDRRLVGACHRAQRDFVVDDSRLISARVGRGGGKTTGQRARFVRRMARVHKAKCVYVTLSRPVAEELMWAPLKDLIESLGIEATFNETKLTCTFKRTGSTLRLVGADDKKEINKLRGQPFDEVCIDEVSSMQPKLVEELIDRVIGPRLGERMGTLVLISTPGTILAGPFYDATRPGSPEHRPYADRNLPEYAGWRRWSSHHWSLADPDAQKIPALANLWAEALAKFEDKGWGPDHPIRRREYEGIWAADETDSIYKYRAYLDDVEWNLWSPPMVRRGELADYGALDFAKLPDGPEGKPRKDWLYSVGIDLGGGRDPFALNVFAASPSDQQRTVYHVFGYEPPGVAMYAQRIAVLLLGPQVLTNLDAAHAKPGGVIGAIGEWPAGFVADTTHLGQLILDELSQVYGIKILPADQKGKHSAVELLNGDLVDGRLKILPASPRTPLATQLAELQWQKDQYGFPQFPKGVADHSADSCLYARRALATIFETIDTAPAARPNPTPTRPDREPTGAPQPPAPPPSGEFASLFDDSGATDSYDSLLNGTGGSVDWG